jgi:hypothetical protein
VNYNNKTTGNVKNTLNCANLTINTNPTCSLPLAINIPDNSTVYIDFEFTAPSKMSTLNVITYVTISSSTGIKYETLNKALQIVIGFAVFSEFSITPASRVTGDNTIYTITFATNANHPTNFYLNLTSP